MSQQSLVMPTTGVVSGVQISQNISNALAALASSNSGIAAPVNAVGSVPSVGQMWLDTSVSPSPLKIYIGATGQWQIIGWFDNTNSAWVPVLGGGTNTLTAGATTDLGSVEQVAITVNGSTGIASFGSGAKVRPGQYKFVTFANAPLITYNATSMILPSGTNFQSAAGDVALALYLGSGNWKVIAFLKADGTAVSSGAIFVGAVYFNGVITPSSGAASINDYNPAGLATANVIRMTLTGSIFVTGIVAPATNGKVLVIDNPHASLYIYLEPLNAGSLPANQFLGVDIIIIPPGGSATLKYDATAPGWRPFVQPISISIGPAYRNLSIINNTVTPLRKVDIAADSLTMIHPNGSAFRWNGVAVTADGSLPGANGLDTGAIAPATFYSVWVIYSPLSNTLAALLSLSATAPTMPAGYTFKARVGWRLTDGAGNFYRFRQLNDECRYVAVTGSNTPNIPLLVSGAIGVPSVTAPTWSLASVSGLVPTTASIVHFIGITTYNAGVGAHLQAAPNNNYAGPSSTNPCPVAIRGDIGPTAISQQFSFVLEGTTIAWASSATGGGISIYGWRDNL